MSFEPKQIQMICLEDLVLENHIYRKFLSLWDMDSVRFELEKLEAESDHKSAAIATHTNKIKKFVGTRAMEFIESFFVCCCSFLRICLIAS